MKKYLTDKELNKMLKEVGPQRVLGRWCNGLINLKPTQRTKLFRLKKDEENWKGNKNEENKKSKTKRN